MFSAPAKPDSIAWLMISHDVLSRLRCKSTRAHKDVLPVIKNRSEGSADGCFGVNWHQRLNIGDFLAQLVSGEFSLIEAL